MKKSIVLSVLALCALPAMAQSQSASLIYTQLTSRNFLVEGSTFTADKSKGFALRYGHDIMSFPQLGDARLAFEGSWLPKTGGQDLKINGATSPSGMTLEFRHEYMGLGLSMAWTKVVDLGVALELRHEGNALHIQAPGVRIDLGNDATRPWLSLRGGYTFAMAKMKPSVGLEFNLPLAKKEVAINTAIGELAYTMIAQDLNPKSQISLIAGFRF